MKDNIDRIEVSIGDFAKRLEKNIRNAAPMPQSDVEEFIREEVDDVITAKNAEITLRIETKIGKLDESCQIIFEDVDKRSQTQCENNERRLQASLKKGLARQMSDIQKSLNSFTVEAQQGIANLQRLGAVGRGIRKSGQSVNFKASSAVISGGPGDDGGDDGDGDEGEDGDYFGK